MNAYQSTPDFYRDYIQHFNPFHNPKNGQFASGHGGARKYVETAAKGALSADPHRKVIKKGKVIAEDASVLPEKNKKLKGALGKKMWNQMSKEEQDKMVEREIMEETDREIKREKELNDKAIAEKWDELDNKTRWEYLEEKVKNIKHPPLTDKPVMTIKTTDGRTWKSESEKSLYGWMNKDQIKQRDEMRIGWEMAGLSKDAIKYCETQFGGTMANVDDPELIELVVMEYEDATGKKGFKKNIDFTKY